VSGFRDLGFERLLRRVGGGCWAGGDVGSRAEGRDGEVRGCDRLGGQTRVVGWGAWMRLDRMVLGEVMVR
jgi:hypothetical protein